MKASPNVRPYRAAADARTSMKQVFKLQKLIGLQPMPLPLDSRIRKALAEAPVLTSKKRFDQIMAEIADGR